MEDAISLAWAVRSGDLDAYEAERRPIVESTQRAAQGSLEWFEGIGRYVHQDPRTFAFNLLTRSRRITHGELAMRDPDFVAALDDGVPPMFEPFRLRSLELANRVVVSPMDMYSSLDGTPGDFHLVHLGARAVGGAGLVMTEMICTSADGRITPGCGGLYQDEHVPAWKRIVDFAHAHSRAAVGCQLGHAGRKGSTQLLWEAEDQPLPEGNWPLIAPSPLPYLPGVSQVPREMTRADLDAVLADFVACTRRANEAGFDLLEIHMAHGYLLSSFLSPLTNVRSDEYGADRAKYPLEVFAACREAWPAEKPMSVRISATDWVAGRLRRRRRGRLRAAAGRGRLRHRRRLDRPGLARPAAGLRAQLPDAVRRPDPPRGGHPGDRRGRDLELRRRQHDHPRRPRRPLRVGPPAPVGSALDAARRRRPGRQHGVDPAVPLGLARAEHRQGRAPAAAAAFRRGPRMTRTVVVTGGKRGIGAAISAAFAGERVIPLASADLDVTDEAAVARVFGEIGPVDVLVNNAGVSSSAPLKRTTLDEWERQIAVNATGAFLCTRAVLEGMRERDRGRIVTVASVASHHGSRYTSGYTASKHAVLGLMRSVAAELAGTGVTATASARPTCAAT